MSTTIEEEREAKVRARMSRIDALPKDIRELIHEHGLSVVQAFLDHGLTKAKAIRHIITQVRTGSIEASPGNGNGWQQAGRTMCVVPLEPTSAMIEASMAEVSGHNVVVDKFEKHRRRLRAAIRAGLSRIA